ncbi:MAG: 4-alpha-glucanotransferase [Acidobacteria bacterium]|nr:4-alpha-glucanotransferase [Acidobacteriota bacterium]
MRKSGILLHPTSLPGECGIGDLGKWAYQFVDFLVAGGQQLWQILPLGPPGCGHSPYQSFSSFAGNPLLINLQALFEQSLLSKEDLQEIPRFPDSYVDFNAVIPFKSRLISKAASAFFRQGSHPLRKEFLDFCERMKYWLDPFAEFAALKNANQGVAWTDWIQKTGAKEEDVLEHQFIQFEFFRQWKSLKKYCNDRGVEIIGDIPIFVAHDSADVWANPQLFDLDGSGQTRTVAGVPPDYFSETGQCWGNPLYRWDVMEQTGYRWWIDRVKFMLETVDIIRLDHFRGFEKYYEIPGDAATAVNGRWKEGPGDRFFEVLQQSLGKIPFIAEDLGYITPEVHALRDRWGFPGMRVIHFAFGDQSLENPHKPHNFVRNCIVYTGTHDNDTTVGWFRRRSGDQVRGEIELALRYMGKDGNDGAWDFIRMALSSVADIAILPMQDVLSLGSEARMNVPATVENNWRWKMRKDQLNPELAGKLYEMNLIYGRLRAF